MRFLNKRLRLIIAGVALAIVGVLGVSHTAFASATLFELASTTGHTSGYCMNNTGGSSTNGNAQELWTCTGGYYLGYDHAASSYAPGWQELTIDGTGKCLSGQGGGDGTAVVEYQCNGSPNQAVCWSVNDYGVATWQFENGEAIGDKNDTAANGNPIVTWSLNGSNSESWFGPGSGALPKGDSCEDLL